LIAAGLVLTLAAIGVPAVALAAGDLYPVVTHNPTTDDQEVYIWSAKTEEAYKLFSLTDDDLLNFASAPKGTTIQFPADYNRGTVYLTYQGKGEFTGKFQDLTFSFYRNDAKGVALGDWNAWALAEARVKALKTLNRPSELAIAEAVFKVLSPLHIEQAMIAEKELVSSVVAKVTEIKDTGDQEIWAWIPDSKVGYKLVTLAKDDLIDFASARVGTTIKFPSVDNRGTVTLTYNGNGKYSGTYLGATFSFTRSDLANIAPADAGCLCLAQARVSALQIQGRTYELNVAKAVLEGLTR
jgi:hypothetical protein